MIKLKYTLFFFLLIIAPLESFCVETLSRGRFPSYDHNQYSEVHVFRDKSGGELGRVLVKFLSGDVFTSLVITKLTGEKEVTLYFVEDTRFIGMGGVEMEAYSPGFYGYRVVLKKDDYIVMSYLRNGGKSISDDVTIEWNYDQRKFQVMKAP